MYRVTYVTAYGYVSTAEMSHRQMSECRFEIVEAIKLSD